MEEFVPTVPYVSERVQYAKKLIKKAEELLESLKTPTPPEVEGSAPVPARLLDSEAGVIGAAFSVLNQLAYGLDEAMKTLNIYADKSFWKEVPEHTYAANDLGTKAKVALARIDPV